MRPAKIDAVMPIVVLAAALGAAPSTAVAAQLTREQALEQARAECRGEIPHVSRGDKGNSRGLNAAGRNPMRECVRAKMHGKFAHSRNREP